MHVHECQEQERCDCAALAPAPPIPAETVPPAETLAPPLPANATARPLKELLAAPGAAERAGA